MPETPEPVRPQPASSISRQYEQFDDEISLLDLAITLARHKKLILGLPVAVALLAAIVTFFIPNSFTATTKILPIGGKDVSRDIYVSLLKSDAVADTLVARYKLQQAFNLSSRADAAGRLMASTKISVAKDGSIEVAVTEQGGRQAALIANAYADELGRLGDSLPLSEVAMRRISLEKQLVRAQQEQVAAETSLAGFKAQAGDVGLSSEIEAYVKSSTALKAQIAAKEVELAFLRNGENAIENSSYVRLQQEINSLWAELGKVEGGSLLTGNYTGPQLEYLRRVREQAYAQANALELRKQVELARIEESNNGANFQVLQKATVPERPSSPQRMKIILIAALAAAFLAVLWAFVVEAVRNAEQDSGQQPKLKLLKESLGWR